jgi:NADPH-dependent ferric siderophore reductase
MEALPIWYVTVTDVQRVTPRMARVSLGGKDLAGLSGIEPDQQVKLYFPKPGRSRPVLPEPDGDFMGWYQAFAAIPDDERPWTRSYTIRAHHPENDTVDVDFVLHHDAGPATRWAQTAKPGDMLGMFGPSTTFARAVPLRTSIAAADWLLLLGDETALPAIGSLVESLPDGTRALVYLEVADASDEQSFQTRGDVTIHWLHRNNVPAGNSDLLVKSLQRAEFPPGSPFAWLAAESTAVRALRRHLVNDRGVPKRSIEFTGHWRLKLTQDDAPTPEDLAEAQDRLTP